MSFLSWLTGRKTATNTTQSQVRMTLAPGSPEIDRNLIEQLRKVGLDLAKPYHVRYIFVVHDSGNADQLAEMLKGRNLTPEISKDLGRWKVAAGEDVVISESAMAARRSEFTNLAGNFGGKYLGWELKVTQTTKTSFTFKQSANS